MAHYSHSGVHFYVDKSNWVRALFAGTLKSAMKGETEKKLLAYLLLLQFCLVPESFQPPSSDALLPKKGGREIFWVISVF
jgi:hypothetical protein